jgi:DNA repair protein RadA/Sms
MRIQVQDGFEWGTELSKIEVPDGLKLKITSGLDYMDTALGGSGFTPSAVTLFTGEAGAGKTTITMTMADQLAKQGHVVVFNTAEESLLQVKMTAQRLGLACRFRVGGETHVPTLLKNCDKLRAANPGKAFFLFVDSLQCMDDGHYPDGQTNSKSAERALALVTDWAKSSFTNPVVIGQVTKGGNFMGSNTLKHMVDTMIHLSIERKDEDLAGCRVLETTKNRFGYSGTKTYLALTDAGFKMVGMAG